jgi:porphobilinogen synthase
MKRLQRLRKTAAIRNMSSEVGFDLSHLVQPLFVVEGINDRQSIPGLKGTDRLPAEAVIEQISNDKKAGVKNFLLFPVPGAKQERGFSAKFASDVIKRIKDKFADEISLWADVCLCSYTSNGHCCLFDKQGRHDLAGSLEELSVLAAAYAAAGADGVAPSDMNDGRTAAIRRTLDQSANNETLLISYSTKFASSFYGPFRHACESAPSFGDRKQYQIDVRARRDAIASSVRCCEEGADLLMVKPGMTSLDLIQPIKEATGALCGAYQVSGEYASLVLLAENGLIDFQTALRETLLVFRRAGASYIITYGARYAAEIGFGASL